MEYLIIFFIVIILSSFNRRLTHRSRTFFLVFVYGYIVLLMGLRYRVGIDTLNYMESYDWILVLDNLFDNDFTQTRFEPGYMLLCALSRIVTEDFWFLQIVHSLILNTCVFVFIYRYTKNSFAGIGVYFILIFFYFSTEILRESLAIAIFLLNYENLRKRRWIRYYLFSLLSISFHYSALILWLFPFAGRLKFNIWYVTSCIAILLVMPWAEWFSQTISLVSIAERISMYVSGVDEFNLNWRIAYVIKVLLCPIVTMLMYKYLRKESVWTSYILLHILLGIGAFAIPIIFSRFTNYTQLFVVVYIADLLYELRYKYLFKYTIVAILFCSQLNYFHNMFWAWYPYESVFTKQKVYEREKLWEQHFGR